MMNNLIIASAHRERITKWRQGLDNLVTTTMLNDRLTTLAGEVAKLGPEVLLLDFDLLGPNGIVALHGICAETRTVVIGGDVSEDMEWELVKAGVRGYCRGDSGPVMLKQVVESVHRGELWIRRKLTCRLIDELGKSTAKNKAYQTSLGLLNKLTMREFDIAVRVGKGESNKQIANSCGITERTVKAHLTEVFIKLGVTDRLNLALVLAAEGRNPELENSDNLHVSKAKLDLNRPLVMGQLNQ